MVSKQKILALGLLGALIISTSACSQPDKLNNEQLQNIASNIEYLVNLRYTGYEEADDQEKVKSIIPKYADQISDTLSHSDEPVFISLESKFQEFESAYNEEEDANGNIIKYNPYIGQESSPYIVEENGARGIYSNYLTIDTEGQSQVVILGQEVYIDMPQEEIARRLIGNGAYKFKLDSYNYYDNGYMYLKFVTDLEGGFEDSIEGYKILDPESQEYKELLEQRNEELSKYEEDETIPPDAITTKFMNTVEYEAAQDSYYKHTVYNEVNLKVKISNGGIIEFPIDDILTIYDTGFNF